MTTQYEEEETKREIRAAQRTERLSIAATLLAGYLGSGRVSIVDLDTSYVNSALRVADDLISKVG
jgi:hypothetical protein